MTASSPLRRLVTDLDRPGSRLRRLVVLLLLVGLATALADAPLRSEAVSPFTATISGGNNTAASATWFSCSNAEDGDSAYLAYSFGDTSGSSAADLTGNGRAGTYQGSVSRSSSKACVRDSSGSTVFNGTNSYVSTPTATLQTGWQSFSIEVRFRTTTAGGMLIGFGSTQTGSSGSTDRLIYMTNSGQLVFGVSPSSNKTVTSPAGYDDGAWHQVAASLSGSGMELYLDGELVASDPAVTTAKSYLGWWRMGYNNLGGWSNRPSNYYFKGNLAFAAVYKNALNAEQINKHYVAGT